jgi:hypothetical protein
MLVATREATRRRGRRSPRKRKPKGKKKSKKKKIEGADAKAARGVPKGEGGVKREESKEVGRGRGKGNKQNDEVKANFRRSQGGDHRSQGEFAHICPKLS